MRNHLVAPLKPGKRFSAQSPEAIHPGAGMYVRFPEFLLKVAVPLPARAGHTMNVRFFALAVPERIVANPPIAEIQTGTLQQGHYRNPPLFLASGI
jgi:hypothetical protein